MAPTTWADRKAAELRALQSCHSYTHFSQRCLDLSDLFSAITLIEQREEDAILKRFMLSESKPPGFWISDEGDRCPWSAQAVSLFGREWASSHHAYEVIVDHDDGILSLSSAEDIDDFTEEYAEDFEQLVAASTDLPEAIRSLYRNLRPGSAIRWLDVMKEYKGIIITPHICERHTSDHALWYNAWDCASGCLWDVSCVRLLRGIEMPEQSALIA